ncbi:MAG: hypothetical protein AAB575_02645 [Patescibacteria group bacterium]
MILEKLFCIAVGAVIGWAFCSMKNSGMIADAWTFLTDQNARRKSH